MKYIKNGIKAAFFILLILSLVLFVSIFLLSNSISSSYRLSKGEKFSINSIFPFTAEKSIDTSADDSGESYDVDLKLFGVIPFSTVNVEVVDENYVCVLGQPFGMRIYTEGVLVVNTKNVNSPSGEVNPARLAGIKVGDYIISVDGKDVTTNEELSALVEESNGKKMRFEIMRNEQTIFCFVEPVKDTDDNKYRIGIMIKDSSAGIGTLTFYDPSSGVVCGLGHGLNDSDTDELIKIESGQMVAAEILSVKKGKKGSPGELTGRFKSDVISDISLNSANGVYGSAKEQIKTANLTEVAKNQEITDGEAQILCTVNGEKPKLYSCTVKKSGGGMFGKEEKLIITVTDKKLINATGGIVQGMSGSPIIQNGKLIGAITHVLVDDPTTGYAIFAENMLETAQSVASGNKLKDAS